MKVKAYYKVKKYCLVDIWSKKEQYPFFFYKVFTGSKQSPFIKLFTRSVH